MQIATPDQRTSFVDAVKRCEVFSTQLRGVILWMQNVDPIAIQPVEEFLTTSNAVTHLFVVLCELFFVFCLCVRGCCPISFDVVDFFAWISYYIIFVCILYLYIYIYIYIYI